MRSTYRYVAIAAAGMLLAPQLAAAGDLESDVADMKQRMEVMEDQLRAQSDDLAAAQATVEKQNDVIEQAGLMERDEVSALSAFIEKTDFNAWVAVSYNYNFRGTSDAQALALPPPAPPGTIPPGTQGNGFNQGLLGAFGPFYPHHSNSNTIELDQAWIEIDKAPTEESRAGAHIDLQAGQATTTFGSGPVGIFTAYVSYLAPIASGIQIDAGIMPTVIGGEVEQTNANFNITRGIVWGLQPVTSTGFLVSMEVMDGFTVAAGMLNDVIGRTPIDGNKSKALTSQIAYSAEKFGAAVSLNYGRTSAGLNFNENQSQGLLDVLLTADPLDNLSLWIDYIFRFEKNRSGLAGTPGVSGGPTFSLNTHGISVAGRLGILESTGIALRYEFVTSTDDTPFFFGGYSSVSVGGRAPSRTFKAHTITATVDHSLTDNMTLRGEVRYDNTSPGQFFNKDGTVFPFSKDGQTVALLQLLYEF